MALVGQLFVLIVHSDCSPYHTGRPGEDQTQTGCENGDRDCDHEHDHGSNNCGVQHAQGTKQKGEEKGNANAFLLFDDDGLWTALLVLWIFH